MRAFDGDKLIEVVFKVKLFALEIELLLYLVFCILAASIYLSVLSTSDVSKLESDCPDWLRPFAINSLRKPLCRVSLKRSTLIRTWLIGNWQKNLSSNGLASFFCNTGPILGA